jgi:two-component system, response regulator YesN
MKDRSLLVMILDDEYLVRELLKNSIIWDEMGMTIAAEASGTMEALDIVEEVQPDIVFVDICMPIMDGLEFSRRVLEKYPQIKIIILTGHDEFEYAKESVKIGVTDFLLKPINTDEIKKVLLRIRENVEEEKLIKKEYSELKRQIEENFPYLKEKFYNDLLFGSLSETEIEKKLPYYSISFKSLNFQIAVIESTYSSTRETSNEENLLILRLQCLEIIKKYFNDNQNIFSFTGLKGNIVLLMNNPDLDISQYCETIKNNLMNRLDCSICIGVGNRTNCLSDISLSYNEANIALKYKVIEGKNNVILFSDIYLSKKEENFALTEHLIDLAFYLRAGVYDKTSESIDIILNQHCADTDIQSIRVSASNIISVILNIMIEGKINSSNIFQYGKQPYDYIFKIETLPEMKSYLKKLTDLLVNSINTIQSKKTCKLVNKIKVYLQEHFCNSELTQYIVAEEFNINSSYLSRKFKQETKQTFVDYLSRLRIEKAIMFFKETDKKNYEIADEVGIADPHYFSIFFKKYMNMSISDYRKKINFNNN